MCPKLIIKNPLANDTRFQFLCFSPYFLGDQTELKNSRIKEPKQENYNNSGQFKDRSFPRNKDKPKINDLAVEKKNNEME